MAQNTHERESLFLPMVPEGYEPIMVGKQEAGIVEKQKAERWWHLNHKHEVERELEVGWSYILLNPAPLPMTHFQQGHTS